MTQLLHTNLSPPSDINQLKCHNPPSSCRILFIWLAHNVLQILSSLDSLWGQADCGGEKMTLPKGVAKE